MRDCLHLGQTSGANLCSFVLKTETVTIFILLSIFINTLNGLVIIKPSVLKDHNIKNVNPKHSKLAIIIV